MSGALRLRLCASATEIIDTDVIDCGWEPEDGEDEYPTIRALEPGEIRLYRAAREPFHAAAVKCRSALA